MIPVPHQIQRQAWKQAHELVNNFADRLTLENRVQMIVTAMYEPERLGWASVGEAVALNAHVKIRATKQHE